MVRLLRRDLTAGEVLAFIIGAMAPLLVTTGVNPTAIGATGLTNLAIVYVVVAIVLLLFIPGYLAVSRLLPNPGAFYAIAARGSSRSIALGAGYVALFAYGALCIAAFGLWGATVAPQVSSLTGLNVRPWQAMLVAWVAVLALGLLRVKITGRVVLILLAAEIAFVTVADLVMFAHPFGGHAQWQSWSVSSLSLSGGHAGAFGAAFCICFLGIVGIEGGGTLFLDSRDGHRTIRRGTIAAAMVIVALYLATAWATAWAAGDTHLVARAGAEQQNLLFDLARPYLGPVLTNIGAVLLDTSVFIGMVSFSTFWSRYAYSMASEGLLPAAMARTRPKAGVPAGATLTLMGFALAAIVLWAVTGLDPLVTLFFYGGTFGGFGVMVLFTITSVSVIGFYLRHRRHRQRDSIWVRLIFPGLAAIALTGAVVLAVTHYDLMLGVTADNPLRVVLPAVFGVILVVCGLVGLTMRIVNRGRYDRIGLGVQAATGVAERVDLDDDALTGAGEVAP
nr:APC family permease [Actinocatenispora comari]